MVSCVHTESAPAAAAAVPHEVSEAVKAGMAAGNINISSGGVHAFFWNSIFRSCSQTCMRANAATLSFLFHLVILMTFIRLYWEMHAFWRL